MTYVNALKKMILITMTCIAFNLGLADAAFAAEDTVISQTTTQTEIENENLKQNDQTRIGHLAELSGKTKEEILKMRTEQNMGWGDIAKSLGIHPGELGKAMRKERKERDIASKLEKQERQELRKAMKERRRDQDARKSEHKNEK